MKRQDLPHLVSPSRRKENARSDCVSRSKKKLCIITKNTLQTDNSLQCFGRSLGKAWWSQALRATWIAEAFCRYEQKWYIIRDQATVHKSQRSADHLEEFNITQIFVAKTLLYQPLDAGVNEPFKSFYCLKYGGWRKKNFDFTKKGYLKSSSRQNVIDSDGNSWSKVTVARISNSIRKSLGLMDSIERIETEQQELDIVDPESLTAEIIFSDDSIQVFNVFLRSLFENMFPTRRFLSQ